MPSKATWADDAPVLSSGTPRTRMASNEPRQLPEHPTQSFRRRHLIDDVTFVAISDH